MLTSLFRNGTLAAVLSAGALLVILVVTLAPLTNEPSTLHLDPLLYAHQIKRGEGLSGLFFGLGANVLLFLPLGFFVPLAAPWFDRVWRAGVSGMVLSTLIEIGQFYLPGGRDADTLDIITNSVGAVCGLLLMRFGRHWTRQE